MPNDEAPATPTEPTAPTEPAPADTFNIDHYAEHALDPDDAGYLFGTAMGRSDS